jgi:hypothetical protein
MDQFRVTGVPDALRKLIEKHGEIFLQSHRGELVARMPFNRGLHAAQFRDALLQSRDAALDVLPRLRAKQPVVAREHGADAHELIRKNHGFRKSQSAQRLHHREAARVKMHELAPIGALFVFQPAGAPE